MNFWVTLRDTVGTFFVESVVEPFSQIALPDVIDILGLAIVLYELYRFFRKRRAGRVLLGLMAVVVCSVLVVALGLPTLTYIVRLFSAAAFFCIVVIFQPELRDALERIGNTTFLNPGSDRISKKRIGLAKATTLETVDAVCKMAGSKTGALIVFEGMTKLGSCIETGKTVDAKITSLLLQNIFYDKAPLHDGAVIIRDFKIHSASCVLPSTNGTINFNNMGTRHRAAVGVTEVSDALVVIVSEQTGIISVAQDGKLLRGVDNVSLYDILMTYLAGYTYVHTKRANMDGDYLEHLQRFSSFEIVRGEKAAAGDEVTGDSEQATAAKSSVQPTVADDRSSEEQNF